MVYPLRQIHLWYDLFKSTKYFPNEDTVKFVLDASHFNTNTDQSFEFWHIGPLVTQLARANKKVIPEIDLMHAYAHAVLLDEETITLTSFLSGDKLVDHF